MAHTTSGWIPLVVPCPVCFSVILLSGSFVSALYPDSSLVFYGFYAGFLLISLVVASLFTLVIRDKGSAGAFLGALMLYIAGYFVLSVIVIPQFADLQKIYRIFFSENAFSLSKETLIVTQQQHKDRVKVEDMGKTLGREMRARYLNPKWIEGMKAEDYAGANAMSNFVEYLWGWNMTTPEKVDADKWQQTYEVYVKDKYNLNIKEFFSKAYPWAFQSITGRTKPSSTRTSPA